MKMNNFLEFIEKDIAAKKTLISTLPTRTKTNKKKYNENIESIKEKYLEYQSNVKNYLLAKSRSFEEKEKKGDIDGLNQKIKSLENIKFLLNPSNTYFEKMGFDKLLYEISNYYVFNFNSLNEIINGFLDKFDLVGIKLTADSFNYTCYVHEYMNSFLEVRYKKNDNYEKVSTIFEQIYWINPDIISHIELNFRRLIRENARKFNDYIIKQQRLEMSNNKIKNYNDCLEKLKEARIELSVLNKESVSDIIGLAKSKQIDISQYLEDNKTRKSAFESLIDTNIDYSDQEKMKKICKALDKLKKNILEYDSYVNFLPLFENFKEEYESLLKLDVKNYKGLKNVKDKIDIKEKELDRINRHIFGTKNRFFEIKFEGNEKTLKTQSVKLAKELYDLYKEYDKEKFKVRVLSVLNSNITVSDVLNLYYSYDYFKKLAIQKSYNLSDYSEILEISDNLYEFTTNPANVISAGLPIFDEVNIARIIANKYRLNNIKIDESDVQPENLKNLLNKVLLVLRVNLIENSSSSIEKIWFISEVNKLFNKENKN